VENDAARARHLESGDYPEDRRLTASRSTEQHDDLILVDIEVDVVKHHRRAKLFADVFDGDCRTVVCY
jgi:hypothetical protein